MLSQFIEYDEYELLNERETQDFKSVYIDLNEKYKKISQNDLTSIIPDLVFEVELIKSQEINLDYILYLIQERLSSLKEHNKPFDKQELEKIINSNTRLRSKKELIFAFIDKVNNQGTYNPENFISDYFEFHEKLKYKALNDLIEQEDLKDNETKDFIADSFSRGYPKIESAEVIKLFKKEESLIAQPIDKTKGFKNRREERTKNLLEKIKAFFEKFKTW
ncbi:conserved domain protein [Mycoplasmopsis alligatoris A21JP2]|uniref:Conserved domain protein n=2 Tax=Mycoplasmopsis alligatoris TaxID=47687 RepID=D4XV98_9BACT|nr:conserved domain protein [Mycoplasmopsis alligatoris A21JP2]